MSTHAVSIVGYGNIGPFHVRNIRRISRKVKGVWDFRPEMRDKIKGDDLYVYQSFEELMQDDEADVIVLAVPNNYHKPLAIDCLRAGKNVICEKPAALGAAELEEMIAAAKESGKLFSIHHNRRWDRDFKIIQKILSEGSIGEPYFIESKVDGSRGSMYGWRGRKENGGGMVLDWGVHILDQMLQLVDSPVTAVDAHLFGVFSDEVDDNIRILLRFENGVSADLQMVTNCFIRHPRWHVSCTKGTAVIENWECEGKIVKLKDPEKVDWTDEVVYTAAGPTRTMAPRPEYTQTTLPLPAVTGAWSDFYLNIFDALDGKAELLVTPEQALRVMKVTDLVFESHSAGHGLPCKI